MFGRMQVRALWDFDERGSVPVQVFDEWDATVLPDDPAVHHQVLPHGWFFHRGRQGTPTEKTDGRPDGERRE